MGFASNDYLFMEILRQGHNNNTTHLKQWFFKAEFVSLGMIWTHNTLTFWATLLPATLMK